MRLLTSLGNLALIATVVSTASCSHKKENTYHQTDEAVSVALPVIDSIVVGKTVPGYISADRAIQIVGRVNGTITNKYYSGGDFVKKGQLLFTIESSQYADKVNQAKAQLETAIANNKYATNRYNALKKALESDAVSQIEVVQAESTMNQSLASIESAKAALNTAQTMLGYTRVVSPADGHISNSTLNVGDYISGENQPVNLATLYDDKVVYAIISVDEGQYIKMKDDAASPVPSVDYTKIPLSFTDVLPHSYTGNLTYVAPSVDKSTGTVKLNVKIDNTYGELKDGMYVVVNLPDYSDPKAILVKDASIATDQRGKYLYTLNDSNRVQYTAIEPGEIVNDSMRIVKSGLKPGQRYVTKALLKVRDGMTVVPDTVK
ncbi:MAG: efflux RND transporter periplasmic adaptor subunit [Muribaculaceae bacterium]|nr:efflux RND transporter periplasmic adaptor subunit [Muribaculaceae bacterium]MDE6642951.1 efflux RND transporter periplasmic adaptor subunit [Muribaculaceae bacterium]